uniref:Dynamin N-terminal domain-containing protein n=1 Tax=Leptobrachium leishanense TaxID=445787 RepID=A0A8C5WCD8_9ANUR
MAGKVKVRAAANAEAMSGTVSINERILRECHGLYTDPESGLIALAAHLGLSFLPPRKKITVMLMGNHSAGKSSFINWYIEEHIQRTGVAIETQGFSFITSGRKRESLTGEATLHLYPHFKPLQSFEGVSEYLCTEISTSRQKKFSLVTFVDSPGLVDGDMKYPFDVNKALLWLGELCELVLVFFDPMGQALCKRTLNIVEKINEHHGDKLRFYLSKADEAGGESDRQRVLMQIVQELCKRPGLNKCGFDMPTIYIPNANKPSRCTNQIEEVCKTIEKTITQTVQNTLNTLGKDCQKLTESIERALKEDEDTVRRNRGARLRGCIFGLGGLVLPLFLLASVLFGFIPPEFWNVLLGREGAETLEIYLTPLHTFWSLLPEGYAGYAFLLLTVLALLLLLLAQRCFRTQSTLSKKQRRYLLDRHAYVSEVVLQKKKLLYEEYLKQSVAEHDMS